MSLFNHMVFMLLFIGVSFAFVSCANPDEHSDDPCQEPASEAFERISDQIETATNLDVIKELRSQLLDVRNCGLNAVDAIEEKTVMEELRARREQIIEYDHFLKEAEKELGKGNTTAAQAALDKAKDKINDSDKISELQKKIDNKKPTPNLEDPLVDPSLRSKGNDSEKKPPKTIAEKEPNLRENSKVGDKSPLENPDKKSRESFKAKDKNSKNENEN